MLSFLLKREPNRNKFTEKKYCIFCFLFGPTYETICHYCICPHGQFQMRFGRPVYAEGPHFLRMHEKGGREIGKMESSILIVEDDAVQRRQMARVLKADGYGVQEASTGIEAVARLAEDNIAIVLTDRKMPGMDGISLLQHVKANFPGIPVAIITAYMEGVEEHHPDAVLGKPFRSQELIDLVRHLLQKTND